ncbi:MAG: serine/threonine protein kinase [Myxococcales bacterium]|nr:serine/threonine protein kinase [Myxococcales bacterium]
MGDLPVFGGCQVIEKLRSEPVADLYHAVQQPLGRPVLLKALSSSILPSSPFAASLEREAHVLAELHHPNILHVHDFVRQADRMWLVLEYVDGWPLDELMKAVKRLPPVTAAAIALEIARALEHAHRHGVVHRDVQPKNVMISRRGHVKLLNFSVAVDGRLPTAPELLDGASSFGGPLYLSPEQILGEPADPRSDLFSLGVVLYELLAGVRPFDSPDDRTAAQRIRHDPAPPLTRAVSGVPAALERTVQRCLEKMPSDRFANTEELVLALERFSSEAGVTSSHRQIAQTLVQSGLTDEAPRSILDTSHVRAEPPEPPAVSWALAGYVVCLGLVVVVGAGIQWLASRSEGAAPGRRGPSELALTPKRPAFLRVVADPWAHVTIDGQRVDTTPFARAIPLTAGTHYVRLEHPNAPTERRTISPVAGETIVLDVKMRIEGAPVPDAGAAELPPAPDSGPETP